jgi:hypothetical protein
LHRRDACATRPLSLHRWERLCHRPLSLHRWERLCHRPLSLHRWERLCHRPLSQKFILVPKFNLGTRIRDSAGRENNLTTRIEEETGEARQGEILPLFALSPFRLRF